MKVKFFYALFSPFVGLNKYLDLALVGILS